MKQVVITGLNHWHQNAIRLKPQLKKCLWCDAQLDICTMSPWGNTTYHQKPKLQGWNGCSSYGRALMLSMREVPGSTPGTSNLHALGLGPGNYCLGEYNCPILSDFATVTLWFRGNYSLAFCWALHHLHKEVADPDINFIRIAPWISWYGVVLTFIGILWSKTTHKYFYQKFHLKWCMMGWHTQ